MLGSSLHATWTKPYQLVQSELPHPILSTATKSCFNHQNLHCSTFLLADNSGNTDYSDLHRWSPHLHSGYKSPAPNDNSSYIYTSDYGSYSSQESNHSGTTCTYSSNNKIIHNIYKYIQFTRYLAVCINFELIKQPWTVDITLIYQQPMYGISDTCGISLWCFSFVVFLAILVHVAVKMVMINSSELAQKSGFVFSNSLTVDATFHVSRQGIH